MKPELDFKEFPPISKAEWKQKVLYDLKGADFDKKLVWKTAEGFSIQPMYTAEDRLDVNAAAVAAPHHWINYVAIESDSDVECNRIAREMKAMGAEGFLFRFKELHHHNFEVLLYGLDPLNDHISFSTEDASAVLISDYLVHLNRSYIRAHKLDGFFECDILEQWSTRGGRLKFHDLANLLKRSRPYPNFRCLVVRSHSFVNAGSNITQELAFTLHKVSDYMEAMVAEGLKPSEVIDELVLHLATGGDYFLQIAKLRAMRKLLAEILDFYHCRTSHVPIVCSGAEWTRTLYEPSMNMLRNTSESMSAILGGCDALLLHPHDMYLQEPTFFSRRIALHTANILREESYFEKVADPAAGAYYIEHLTDELVQSTLSLFREIEAKGGYFCAFKDGIIQSKIREQRELKQKEINTRKRVFIGTNKYADPTQEVRFASQAVNTVSDQDLLQPQRGAAAFEAIRTNTAEWKQQHGRTPLVYLACFGNDTMRRARAAFAADFFHVAGFRSEENFNDNIEELAAHAMQHEADVVVLCSSDEDYAVHAQQFVTVARSVNNRKILVLAGNIEALDAEHRPAVDYCIHIKSDCAALLAKMQQQLFAEQKVETL